MAVCAVAVVSEIVTFSSFREVTEERLGRLDTFLSRLNEGHSQFRDFKQFKEPQNVEKTDERTNTTGNCKRQCRSPRDFSKA